MAERNMTEMLFDEEPLPKDWWRGEFPIAEGNDSPFWIGIRTNTISNRDLIETINPSLLPENPGQTEKAALLLLCLRTLGKIPMPREDKKE